MWMQIEDPKEDLYSVFANASLMNSNKKISVTVSGNFPKLLPRNYESVTFGQFCEGGGRTLTGPSATATFINPKQSRIGNGVGNFL